MRETDTIIYLCAMIQTPYQKKYINADIAWALDTLKKNENNLLKTSKETGVARSTLRRWAEEFADKEIPVDEDGVIILTAEEAEIAKLDEAINAALDKTRALIPKCKTAVEASTVAKNLVKIKLDLVSENLDDERKSKRQNILQATINILNKYD